MTPASELHEFLCEILGPKYAILQLNSPSVCANERHTFICQSFSDALVHWTATKHLWWNKQV